MIFVWVGTSAEVDFCLYFFFLYAAWKNVSPTLEVGERVGDLSVAVLWPGGRLWFGMAGHGGVPRR